VSLRDVLVEAADDEDDAIDAATDVDGSTTWAIAGRPFATLDADGLTASFRLDAVLADAARRTPDTSASPRGAEWASFRPAALDGHAEDRARAWFAAAARRARG
jgi:hypothetical protein